MGKRLEVNEGLPKYVRYRYGAYYFSCGKAFTDTLGRSEIKLGELFDGPAQMRYAEIMNCVLTGDKWAEPGRPRKPQPAYSVPKMWRHLGYSQDCKIPLPVLSGLLGSAKNGAKSRGLSFNIWPRNLIELAVKADGRCMLTGVPWDYRPYGKSHRAPFAPSLDRINSAEGYEPNNIRLVCVMANFALADFGDKAWRKFAQGIEQIGEELRGNTVY